MAAPRPQPRFPEPDTQPFWEATKRHELIFYPRRHCPACGSLDTTWHLSTGEGTVYTFSVVVQSRNPAFADLGPYVLAYVDLDEGFRMMTNIIGVPDPVNTMRCGMRVRVCWQDQDEGQVSLPMFEPAES